MFTRQTYDDGYYKQDLYQSTEPSRYMLLPETTHRPDTCFQETPEIHAANGQYKISSSNDMVNVESDLRNLNRKASKDPRAHYPYVKPTYGNQPSMGVCTTTELSRVYPLLDGNQFNREQQIQVPRFESLCLNPQQLSRVRSNNFIGLNTRLFNRDKSEPNIPTPETTTNTVSSGTFTSPLDTDLQKMSKLGKPTTEQLIAQAEQMKNYQLQNSGLKEGFCGSCSGGAVRR